VYREVVRNHVTTFWLGTARHRGVVGEARALILEIIGLPGPTTMGFGSAQANYMASRAVALMAMAATPAPTTAAPRTVARKPFSSACAVCNRAMEMAMEVAKLESHASACARIGSKGRHRAHQPMTTSSMSCQVR